MAKPCTFETYHSNGDPLWCCAESSTQKVSKDVVNEVNAFWQGTASFLKGKGWCFFVGYIDLCDAHAKTVKETYDNLQKQKEVEDEMHIQVDKT